MHRLFAIFGKFCSVLAGILLTISLAGCFGDSSVSKAEEELEQARKAYVERRYLEAERLYERYLKLRDTDQHRWEVWNRLVELAANVRGDTKGAAELLETMLLEYGEQPERARDILKRIGALHQQKRQWDKAIAAWLRLIEMGQLAELAKQDMAYVHQQLGRAYFARSEYDLAIDSFQQCAEVYKDGPDRGECLYDLAQAHAVLESFSVAEQYLVEVLDIDEMVPERRSLAVLLLADIKEQQEDYNTAKKLLKSIKNTYPNPQVIHTRLRYLRDK